MPLGWSFSVCRKSAPHETAKHTFEETRLRLERIEFEETFFAVSHHFDRLQKEEFLNPFEGELFAVFWRSAAFGCFYGRQEQGGIFAELPDGMNARFDEGRNEGLLHIPGIAKEQQRALVVFVPVCEFDQFACDFELRPVAVFMEKLHAYGQCGMFLFVLSNEEQGDEQLRKWEVRAVVFLCVVEVNSGTGSFFRRSVNESVVDSEDYLFLLCKGTGHAKP